MYTYMYTYTYMITSLFMMCQVQWYRNILKLSCRGFAFTSYKAFLKLKRSLELVSLSHSLHDF